MKVNETNDQHEKAESSPQQHAASLHDGKGNASFPATSQLANLVRKLQNKLKQAEALSVRETNGATLNEEELDKVKKAEGW